MTPHVHGEPVGHDDSGFRRFYAFVWATTGLAVVACVGVLWFEYRREVDGASRAEIEGGVAYKSGQGEQNAPAIHRDEWISGYRAEREQDERRKDLKRRQKANLEAEFKAAADRAVEAEKNREKLNHRVAAWGQCQKVLRTTYKQSYRYQKDIKESAEALDVLQNSNDRDEREFASKFLSSLEVKMDSDAYSDVKATLNEFGIASESEWLRLCEDARANGWRE